MSLSTQLPEQALYTSGQVGSVRRRMSRPKDGMQGLAVIQKRTQQSKWPGPYLPLRAYVECVCCAYVEHVFTVSALCRSCYTDQVWGGSPARMLYKTCRSVDATEITPFTLSQKGKGSNDPGADQRNQLRNDIVCLSSLARLKSLNEQVQCSEIQACTHLVHLRVKGSPAVHDTVPT